MTTLALPNAKEAKRPLSKPVTPGLWGSIGYLLRLWQRYWPQTQLIIPALILHELFRTFFALRLKAMLDSLQIAGIVENLALNMGVIGLGFLIAVGARLFSERLIAQTGGKLLNDLRTKMFQKLQQLSASYYARTTMGNIMARFSTDLANIERAATLRMRDGLLDVIEILLNLPVLFYLDWRLALVPLMNIGVMTLVVRQSIPKATAAGYAYKNAEGELAGELQESIRGHALIRAFGLEPLLWQRFQAHMAVVEKTGGQANLVQAQIVLSARSLILLSRVICVGLGVWLVMQGSLSIGALVAFLNLLALVNNAADDLTRTVVPDFIAVASGIQRIEELLQEPLDVVIHPNAIPLTRLKYYIRFKQVSFTYTGEADQLHNIELLLTAGKRIAIVGPSGSGKSTLLTLLMRGRDVTSGILLYDGVDIRNVTRESLQQQMGVVFQETYLFNTTIRENIRMAKPDATNTEVEEAARSAEIHDLIMSLPHHYETLVGEAGGLLSGGQRQRVAIARAIIRNPALLILDEATSALDPGTETAINATLERLSRARTVITVTHRLSAITTVDQIVVLSGGHIAEVGTHENLLKREGLYAQLWQRQSGFEISADGRTARVHATYLRTIELFAGLDTNTLTAIANRFSTQYVNQGQLVFQQGDVGDRFYLIARGRVDVLARNMQGIEQKIDTMSDGDCFGETALLQDAPRNATIRTVTNCLFLTLPKQEFLALLEELPSLRSVVESQIERIQLNRARQHVDGVPITLKSRAKPNLIEKVSEWWRPK
ncbi:MAG: ATP-binding cassette domain-containing protein [Caldilineaceae bacterium]|nr:ATP-binding cassette domain-containing protein [Caldilineaceae bacterium]